MSIKYNLENCKGIMNMCQNIVILIGKGWNIIKSQIMYERVMSLTFQHCVNLVI